MLAKLSPNLPTPDDVAATLLARLRQTGRQFFVDAGCGSGELLLRIARACPAVQCHGLELSAGLATGLRAAIGQAGLPNVTVHEADLRHALEVVPAADFVFAYVGGALHQALALHLAARAFEGTFCSALYPGYPLPVTHTHAAGSLPLFEYEFPACSTRLLWDAPASVSLAPGRGYALLSRAATFYKPGRLTVQVHAPAALHGCVAVQLAQPTVVVGQTLLLDIIVDTSRLPKPVLPSLVAITLACEGVALWPSHPLIVGYHPTEAVELALDAPAEALLHSVQTHDYTTFYQLLAAYQDDVPTVQHYQSQPL